MTATFGKLEHDTLTLEPGLNVLEAPNEWGKTTWCAFLLAMLYGLDTRAKSTKTALADKLRYTPWSGSPMAGRIDLNWQGRDITIERSTTGRTPLGVFRAYETQTGLAIPELTADNCGQTLLGVEQSVYRRTGFLRQSDMPVTQDDALRRRLNALVTTGDETGDGDRLETALKDLKNKCRYNKRTGLLPQAESQKQALEEKLVQLDTIQTQSQNLRQRLAEEISWMQALENHRASLLYAAAQQDAQRVAQAKAHREQKAQALSHLETLCAKQPCQADVAQRLQAMDDYRQEQAQYQAAMEKAGSPPVPPPSPAVFANQSPAQAVQMAAQDAGQYAALTKRSPLPLLLIAALGLLCLFAAVKQAYPLALVSGILAVLLAVLQICKGSGNRRKAKGLEEKYGAASPETWQQMARDFERQQAAYQAALDGYHASLGNLDSRRDRLVQQREALFGDRDPQQVYQIWQDMDKNWQARQAALQELNLAEQYLKNLNAMAKPTPAKPAGEDLLSQSLPETVNLISQSQAEQQRLQNRLSQYAGQMDALGDRQALQAQLTATQQRIAKLEDIYAATVLALDTLDQAKQALQRRFAPQITQRARELLEQMTGGRYDRLTFNQDLSLLAAADGEDTLREALWRSDGTADQLYVALRLAVAEALIPDAPLVLDDALVRFDDTRLAQTLEILKQEAQQKQVILFTCQHREAGLL